MIVFPFTILGEEVPEEGAQEENNLVTNVQFELTPFATIVSLLTDDTVAEVKIDSKEMHYKGGSKYSAAIVGLDLGEKVKITAYDASGKKIFEKEYTVE